MSKKRLMKSIKFERRNQFDIMCETLEQIRNGAKKTWIMSNSRTSFAQHKSYLEFLERNGFIKHEINGGNGYEVLEKGKEFIKDYRVFKGKYFN
jgi:predicted transcriptional regulator